MIVYASMRSNVATSVWACVCVCVCVLIWRKKWEKIEFGSTDLSATHQSGGIKLWDVFLFQSVWSHPILSTTNFDQAAAELYFAW
jgi:hypothetical protein